MRPAGVVVLACLLGIPAGIGGFTFVYVKGFSYLSADPRACVKELESRELQAAALQHRKAQWRLDFVAAENSMGFHAPQELAPILGEVIDHARQGQLEAERTRRALS